MRNNEDHVANQTEHNIIHINTHLVTKQIHQLLRTLNPHIKSANLNAHFNHLLHTLVKQDELLELDLRIKLKSICVELEKYIPGSKATIFIFDPNQQRVTNFVSPSLAETIQNFSVQYNQNEIKVEKTLNYKMRISNISQDCRWAPYYHHFTKLGLSSCWTLPVYRTPQFISIFTIFTEDRIIPVQKELHVICEKMDHFQKLIRNYPADFTMNWMQGSAKTHSL